MLLEPQDDMHIMSLMLFYPMNFVFQVSFVRKSKMNSPQIYDTKAEQGLSILHDGNVSVE